ncbi:MAG: hypothetical protein KC900_06430 [Candidatus Omnitrophica bacterium]|nr:hypothetical protein [Candidatus Omnitrophota bacterium]
MRFLSQKTSVAYATLLVTSFIILILQIILASYLRAYLKLPFLSVSFAFLGLSSAGLVAYYYFRDLTLKQLLFKVQALLQVFGILLIFYFCYFFQNTIQSQINPLVNLVLQDQIPTDQDVRSFFAAVYKLSFSNGLYFSLCFFVVGLIFSLIYKFFSEEAAKLYFYDLCGATLGCVLGSYLLNVVEISTIPILIALIAFIFALLINLRGEGGRLGVMSSAICALLAGGLLLSNTVSDAFHVRIENEVWSEWNAYSRVTLVKKGFDEKSGEMEYKFMLDNGAGIAHVVKFKPDDPYRLKPFEEFSAATLAFLKGTPDDMLVLCAGAGNDMVESYSYSRGRTDITGIELNPLIVKKARSTEEFHLKEFFERDGVHMIVAEGRTFLEATDRKYSVVLYSWAGSPRNTYLGITANTSQFLYTREAFLRVLNILKDDGYIGIVNGNKLKLLGSFKKSFAALGVDDISAHVVLVAPRDIVEAGIRSNMLAPVDNARLLVKRTPFTAQEVRLIQSNAGKMDYLLVYAPHTDGLDLHSNSLEAAKLIRTVTAARDVRAVLTDLSNRQLADYRPISDDKPFLDNYYHLPSLLSIGFWKDYFAGNSQLAFSHHLLHFYNFAFVLVLILAGALMLGATLLIKRREVRIRRDLPWLYFFSCLGLAFMFVEISFLYQFILYLGNPIYSFSVILAGVLFSLGLGSLASDKLCGSRRLNLRTIAILCAGILVAGYVYIPWVITRTLGMGLAWRILLAFVIILPTGFILGMMFPQGIKLVGRINRNLLPLAWGLNGYLSVIGSALSIYLAPIVGFSGLSLIGAALYVTLVLIPLGMPEEG